MNVASFSYVGICMFTKWPCILNGQKYFEQWFDDLIVKVSKTYGLHFSDPLQSHWFLSSGENL